MDQEFDELEARLVAIEHWLVPLAAAQLSHARDPLAELAARDEHWLATMAALESDTAAAVHRAMPGQPAAAIRRRAAAHMARLDAAQQRLTGRIRRLLPQAPPAG